jgi:transposase-like protein
LSQIARKYRTNQPKQETGTGMMFRPEDPYVPQEPPRATEVPIADIVLRTDWQVRSRIHQGVVWNYVTATLHGRMPPIRLARVKGALMLVDGWHRLYAAKQLKRDSIRATVEDMSEDQARWAAAEANTTHGLPLNKKEKCDVFRRYIETGQHLEGRQLKSYREIARELHGIAGKSTLQRWMREHFPEIAARMATGRPAKTELPAQEQQTHRYQQAKLYLQQIVAGAPAFEEHERQSMAEQLKEAADKVLTAMPWTAPEPTDPMDL